MYDPTFAVDAIGDPQPDALDLALECMSDLLTALVSIDRRYLRRYAGRIPRLYDAGVSYDRLAPAPGSACGDDKWADIITILERQGRRGDCEDLCCWRTAELQELDGVAAAPYVSLSISRGRDAGRHLYHVFTRWPFGLASYPPTVYRAEDSRVGTILLEDVSRVLGMR